ncbi:hypothetical protein E2562_004539 [Oryza meyeriana var. granulata]|uniref:Uncharacterized protein n=1 Tax=Oryza meyeriana var. granulata TaxID=110450 RepID=A0A6G1F3B9_9ORYZ|nr:hypothetical protein E2562_004539 [Oryza meyeriana var. granulata]
MAATARACNAVRFAFAEEVAPPETPDVVRRQQQLLRRAAARCLDPIAEETDEHEMMSPAASPTASPAGSTRP